MTTVAPPRGRVSAAPAAPLREHRGPRTTAKVLTLTAVMAIGAAVVVAPLYWMVIASTHTSAEIFSSPPVLLPGDAFWENLRSLVVDRGFGRAVANSFLIAAVYTVVAGFVCTLAGYAFAKFEFRGKGIAFGLIMATLVIPAQVTLVPLFQIMLWFGWLDTYQAILLPNLAFPFGIFLMRQTMLAVPDELLAAGRIDGCGEVRLLFGIVLPTMRPAVAALAIYLFLAQWNDFVWPLIALRSPDSYTVPVALAALKGIGTTDYGQLLAGTTVSIVPAAIVFLLLQRHFVAGILSGAVKE
ncbi:carbohydrate ABC transporter permease [Oerskovia flava]|uniref:carbohydrate ABC transporter permease n=1 Tax=Oerskovia flava TaxID=2986422 RepID=UPI00223FD11B|nr:carbohydrate ABC transporter permease [Oerskovia sp. JB1-3-2]